MHPFMIEEIALYVAPYLMAFIVYRFFQDYLSDGQRFFFTVADVCLGVLLVCTHFISQFIFGFSVLSMLFFIYSIVYFIKLLMTHSQGPYNVIWDVARPVVTSFEVTLFILYLVLIVLRIIQIVGHFIQK